MTGAYKLRRAAWGQSHYAHVAVEIKPSVNASKIVVTAEHVPRGWSDAAGDGALATLRWKRPHQDWTVDIKSCEGHPADTDVDAIWCAAVLATLGALRDSSESEPRLDSRSDYWYVRVPGRELKPPPAILALAARPRR
jgi:hypothetical protein